MKLLNKKYFNRFIKKSYFYRVQEIIDLSFKKSKINSRNNTLEDTELF